MFRHSKKSLTKGWLALSMCALGLLFAATAAQAATVTTTKDGGPGSLRQAITLAKSGETIALPAGTYVLTQGELKVGADVTIAGAGATTTKISGNKSSRIFNVLASSSFTLTGVTLTEGKSPGAGSAIREVEDRGNLTLRHDVIAQNGAGLPSVELEGGAISFFGHNLTMADTKVAGNVSSSPGAFGGVIGGGMLANGDSLAVERSSFEGNVASAHAGAGASVEEEGAVLGGGALLSARQSLNVVDSTFSDNIAESANSAGSDAGLAKAGGLAVQSEGGKARLTRVTVTRNEVNPGVNGAGEGGGLVIVNFSGTPVELTGSTIASNSLLGGGGARVEQGFFNGGGNIAAAGEDAISFTDTIVANGTGPAGSEDCGNSNFDEKAEPAFLSAGFNLESGTDCHFASAGDVQSTDPLLGSLRDNGGPTKTMLPAANSPVIDQGTSAGSHADQRGLARPVDLPGIANSTAAGADGSDIGAVEVQASK